jgi:hypothetical protein
MKPISNAKIHILGGNSNGGFNGSSFFLVDTIFTDENGLFNWNSSTAENAQFYSIQSITKKNYFNIENETLRFGNSEDGAIQTVLLKPYSWLDLKVIDDPTIETEYFDVNGSFFNHPGQFGAWEEVFTLRGEQYHYLYIREGFYQGPSQKDSIYLPALDTTYLEYRF